ncbi:uncharacterized protein LOC143293176 [Babylonia areolata]|uniref:uncharacterized protein LOC143293176 n=1 Tax=Babylonia areolata TaxID=304850 RepID=UPI003FCEEADB
MAGTTEQTDMKKSSVFSLDRARRLSRAIKQQMSNFVGVEESQKQAIKWENRRRRCAQTMGTLKPEYADMQFVDESGASRSRTFLPVPTKGRKESVAMMTLHGLNNIVGSS